MLRGLAYPLVWMLATAVTVSGSWLGIRSVLDAAAPDRANPLSAAELRRAAPTTAPATTPPPTVAAPPPTAPPSPAATTVKPPPSRAPVRPPAPRPTGPVSDPRWLPVSDGDGGTAYRRTLRVQGGEATVLVGRDVARVLAVRPASGYSVVVNRFDDDSIVVSFIAARHTSRVLASWRNGPQAELSESV